MGGTLLAKRRKVNTLCVIEAKIKREDVNVTVKNYDIKTWQKRLSHVNEKGLETLARKEFLPSFTGMSLKTCVYCLAEKTHRVPFKSFSPSRNL